MAGRDSVLSDGRARRKRPRGTKVAVAVLGLLALLMVAFVADDVAAHRWHNIVPDIGVGALAVVIAVGLWRTYG